MAKRRIPPSRREDRILPLAVELVEHFLSVAADNNLKLRESLHGLDSRQAAITAIRAGMVSFRQCPWGVVRVQLPNGDEEWPLPPPDFPRGHRSREDLLDFIRRRRLDVPEDLIAESDDSRDGNDQLHLAMALVMMAGHANTVSAPDEMIAFFLGWREEESGDSPERN